jgi:hypothetical protein
MALRSRRFDLRQAGRRIALGMGLLAAANALFFFLFVQPTIRAQRASEEHQPFRALGVRREVVESHEAFLAAVQQAVGDLTSLRDEILATRNQRLVEVHAEIARLCDQFGIDLETVGYEHELLLDEGLDRMGMSVPLEGSYASLRKFLQAAETSDKFLIVERVSLAKGKEGGQKLSLNIHLATYFMAPEELVERKRTLSRRRRG